MDFRTDLALERQEISENISGISCDVEKRGNCKITRIKVENEEGAEKIGKPIGNYITIEISSFSKAGEIFDEKLKTVADELTKLIPKKGTVLVVGLGNKNITPDCLGPECVSQLLATRHITDEISKSMGLGKLRSVAAVAPGVLGQTGIETVEIISGVVKTVKPSAVITVDALASRRVQRLGRTIQICDTGISPGSGVGNARAKIDEKTLGVPVISIGVPTVVDAATLVYDVSEGQAQVSENNEFAQMMVTPKEIDLLSQRAAKTVAMAINASLQSNLPIEDILTLLA